MYVTSFFLPLLAVMGFSTFAFSAPIALIDQCLGDAGRKTHVIDQQQAIEACFLQNSRSLSQNQCEQRALKIGQVKRHLNMSETLHSICFYQATEFRDLKSCLAAAENFRLADNHDEAVFDCYKQFQQALSEKQCIEVSRKMIYPAKKSYLYQHCLNGP